MTDMHRIKLILQLAPMIFMSSFTPFSCRAISSDLLMENYAKEASHTFIHRNVDSCNSHVPRRKNFQGRVNIADPREQLFTSCTAKSNTLCLRGGSGGSESPRFASPELPHSFDLQHLNSKSGSVERRGTKRPIPETASEFEGEQDSSAADLPWSSRWNLDPTTNGYPRPLP